MYEELKENIKKYNQQYANTRNIATCYTNLITSALKIKDEGEEFKLLDFKYGIGADLGYISLLFDELKRPDIATKEIVNYLNIRRVNEHLRKISLEFQAIKDETNEIIFGEEIEND